MPDDSKLDSKMYELISHITEKLQLPQDFEILINTPSNIRDSFGENQFSSDKYQMESKEIIESLKVIKFEEKDVWIRKYFYIFRGQFYNAYSKYIRPIPVLSSLLIFSSRAARFVYRNCRKIRFTLMPGTRWLPVVKMSDYVKLASLPTVKLLDSVTANAHMPNVFPAKDRRYLISPDARYVFPPMYIAEVTEALVFGHTNFVFADGNAICHDFYELAHDFTCEELHGFHLVDAKNMRMRLLVGSAAPKIIEVAATFIDACANNYAHWLTEVLPRIATFCSKEEFISIPIIVNDGLHKNIMESLAIIVGSEREVIVIPRQSRIQVAKLYVTSAAGYVPFGVRSDTATRNSHGKFNPLALSLMLNQIVSYANQLTRYDFPPKIFLRRSQKTRLAINNLELEKIFKSHGYALIAVEKLTFLQQVTLFLSAKEIASPTGAALANALFCSPSASLIVFMPKHKNMIYRYWINLLPSFANRMTYFLSSIVANHHLGIHGDYCVNLKDIGDFLNSTKGDDL